MTGHGKAYDMDIDEAMVDALAEVMICKQCTWLNIWTNSEEWGPDGESGHQYRPTDFSERNQWGWRKVVGLIYDAEFDPESLTLQVNMHDGDEGSSQTLTGFFQAKTMGIYVHYRTGIEARGDDLDWGERGGAASWNYVRTELEGWDLVAMVQEFDTMHTMVLKEGHFINTPDDLRFAHGLEVRP